MVPRVRFEFFGEKGILRLSDIYLMCLLLMVRNKWDEIVVRRNVD